MRMGERGEGEASDEISEQVSWQAGTSRQAGRAAPGWPSTRTAGLAFSPTSSPAVSLTPKLQAEDSWS